MEPLEELMLHSMLTCLNWMEYFETANHAFYSEIKFEANSFGSIFRVINQDVSLSCRIHHTSRDSKVRSRRKQSKVVDVHHKRMWINKVRSDIGLRFFREEYIGEQWLQAIDQHTV